LFATLTKTAGVCTNNSHNGTPFRSLAPTRHEPRPLHPFTANWLSSTPSDKIASLPTRCRQMDRANEESL
jgi:hypothetical protein